ncbi:GNAT family N-acetyltransferase [Marinobacter sp. NFXS9]|uniref:GNAT family N-acetyltransferase n=1 Tax=Marinobacter sp. NFXS9 TaxID=2818433 RepID=UPI0032DF6A20
MEIQAATLDDCPTIAELQVQVWRHAYRGILPERYLASLSVPKRETMWRHVVEQQQAQLLVACIAGKVSGFIVFGPARDADAPASRAEIWAIYVQATSWSGGVGRRLWLQARQDIAAEGYESISLWVLAKNARAIRFYEHAGFDVHSESRKWIDIGGATVEERRCLYPVS